MSSNYPDSLDTDAQIPRIDDNITEIGGEAINSLRDAVFAIEKALGIDPQGNSTDLVSRLSTSIDNAGNLKASALSAAGLVTLPIYNNQIAANAGIEESKLDLNYSTASLKTTLDSLSVLVNSINSILTNQIGNLGSHVSHPSSYGRHYASDIDVNESTSSFDGNTVQQSIDTLDDNINNHINKTSDAHNASAISLEQGSFQSLNSDNVQSAIEELEGLELLELNRHRDRNHANGLLNVNEVSLDGYNHSIVIIDSSAIRIDSGDQNIVKYIASPSAVQFGKINRNDQINVVINGKTYVRVIKNTEGTNRVLIYGSIPTSGTGTAAIYQTSEENFTPTALKVTIRNSSRLLRPAILQLIHPSAAYIIGSRQQNSLLDPTHRNLRFRFYGGTSGDTGDIDIYTEMLSFSTSTSTWTAKNIARVLNENIFAPPKTGLTTPTHYPLAAFDYRGELGIAYDEAISDGYIEIASPSANSASSILGFTEGDISYNLGSRIFYDDGYELDSIRKLVDTTAVIDTPDTLRVSNKNLILLNLPRNSLIRIDGSSSNLLSGTFVSDDIIASGSDTLIEFDSVNELDFDNTDVGKSVNIKIYSDFISQFDTLQKRTFYDLLIDGYEKTRFCEFQLSPRVEYEDTSGGGASLEDILDVTAVSRNFPKSSKRMFYDASEKTLIMGDQGSGISITNSGSSISVPTPSTNEEGKKLTIYNSGNIEYLEMKISGTLPSGDGYLDLQIYDSISEERFFKVGTILNDKNQFLRLDDERIFGTTGRYEIRDDFIRDYIDYPRSLLRSNGIIYGLSITGNLDEITVDGGQVLVDGSIKALTKKTFNIFKINGTFNIFVDRDGIIRMEEDNIYISDVMTTLSTAELVSSNTETIIAKITSDGSGNYSTIEDLRRFVNKIDDKFDIIVEENSITHGFFASLKSAVLWINYFDSLSLPISRRIRVRGIINVTSSTDYFTLPNNVILEGDSFWHTDTSTKYTEIVIKQDDFTQLVNIQNKCIIKNIIFRLSSTSTNTSASGILGTSSDIDGVLVDGCSFIFSDVSKSKSNSSISSSLWGMRNSIIKNCYISDGGVFIDVLNSTLENCIIENNLFKNQYGLCLKAAILSKSSFNKNIIESFTGMDDFIIYCQSISNSEILENNIDMTNITSFFDKSAIFSILTTDSIIKDNILKNAGSSLGFRKAIDLTTVTNSNISNNNISGNDSPSPYGVGIEITTCNSSIISNNIITDQNLPIYVTEDSYSIISNNYFENSLGKTAASFGNFDSTIIVDNSFYSNFNGSDNIDHLVKFSNFENVLFNNNLLRHSHSGTSSKALLYLEGATQENISITNNLFASPNGTDYSIQPFYNSALSSSDLFTTLNNFQSVTYNAGNNKIYNVDYDILNKGQEYIHYCSIDSATEVRGYTGVSSWRRTLDHLIADQTYFDTNYKSLFWDFSNDVFPIGAKIQSVTFRFNISNLVGAEVLTMNFEWVKNSFGTLNSTVSSNIYILSNGLYERTLTSTETVLRNQRHRMSLTIDNIAYALTAWTLDVYSIKVTYIL